VAAVSENYVNVMIINYERRSLSSQMNENSFLSNSLMGEREREKVNTFSLSYSGREWERQRKQFSSLMERGRAKEREI